MFRQREEPRGIFGAGWAISDAYEEGHWDKYANSPTSMYVDLEFESLLNPATEPILQPEQLATGTLRSVNWRLRFSGIRIREAAAMKLERIWADFLKPPLGSRQRKMRQGKQIPPNAGAGFGDPDTNANVEAAAVQFVTDRYEDDGWEVESVEREKCGFDLRCRKGRERKEVEVKGVTGTAEAFVITAGEVAQARTNPRFTLCVVTRAASGSPKVSSYSGKMFLERFALDPIQYRARPRR